VLTAVSGQVFLIKSLQVAMGGICIVYLHGVTGKYAAENQEQ
jgi:hypothetical protein